MEEGFYFGYDLRIFCGDVGGFVGIAFEIVEFEGAFGIVLDGFPISHAGGLFKVEALRHFPVEEGVLLLRSMTGKRREK